jgi:hypothetical protein
MDGNGMSRRDEMQALLPFYLNGTLEGAELAAVEEWLATDPQAAAALVDAEAELLADTTANEAIRPPADALSRFAAALEAEAGPAVAGAQRAATVVPLWSRLRMPSAGVAWAVAAALLAVVFVQQVSQPGGSGTGYEVAGADAELIGSPFALVRFKPEAKMADIAGFLAANGLKIVTGPNADGVFRIALPAANGADYDRLLALVAEQPFTDAALAGRRPVDG